ncbi:MAG: nucleotidyltransferase domain-containing protein [Elusimicrobiales bacterium]|nr:nucleotidyltransferase domain-containing protein [Elusimicrobiales bacterium]
MGRQKAFISYPLDWVFAAPSQLAVLRALKDTSEGMSGRAAARAAGVNHQACKQALDRLEAIGLVIRQGSGHTQLLRLNFGHQLVKEALLPLFAAESAFRARLSADIARGLGGNAGSVTIFGSSARGEDRPGSDIDLLLVTDRRSKAALADKAAEFGRGFTRKYGIRLSPIIYTAGEARARYEAGDPLIANILAHGVDLLEKKLREILL